MNWSWWLAYGTMGLLMLVGLLLMVVILLQRGRGGGLAGAFGGAGGQSAFGTRAGDVFTKITAIMAILWVFLAGVSRFALDPAANQYASEFKSEAGQDTTPEITTLSQEEKDKKEAEKKEEQNTPPAGDGKAPETSNTPEKTDNPDKTSPEPDKPKDDVTPPPEKNETEKSDTEKKESTEDTKPETKND